MDIEQLAGARLGNYEIENLLGRGGMGVVYKARQISLNRPVALKVLPPALSSDASYIKRFKREAEAVARLSHPNILHIYDVGEDKNLHFFSMEYVEGKTLDDEMKDERRLPVDKVVRIIVQAAQGIEHAHENNILHRDIKPSNIILDKRGNVKVMDFGLARMTDDHSKLTQSGALMGTLDYMSPEQCRGEELDERTDIYSLGVVLYEMLTGRVPFDASNEAALIHKIITEKPPNVQDLTPEISPDLGAIISRAISKDKKQRYADISELLKELQEIERQKSSLSIARKKSPSIAVLPFSNMSADPDQEYFCDGMAEELINALTQIENLHVVARTSAFSFKGEKADIQEIGRKLKVGTVLEGSVRKVGNRLRITAQLVKVADGYHLWSERYDREMDDVFAIQDEITSAIVDKLKPRLLGEDKAKPAKRRAVDLEAYNLYLRGRLFTSQYTQEAFKKAIECFEQAIEKEPDYAPAYAGLSACYSFLPLMGPFEPKKTFPTAREAALKALQLDDDLAEAHRSMAQIKSYYDWDWRSGEREFKRAIELNPGDAISHMWYALFLMRMGRHDEAINEADRALELDPLSLYINQGVGHVFCFTNELDRAISVIRRVLEIDPNYSAAHILLGLAYWFKAENEEAMAEFQVGMEVSLGMEPVAQAMVGTVCALTGMRDESLKIREDLLERSRREYVPAYFLAHLSFALGETDRGFEFLDKAYEEHDLYLSVVNNSLVIDLLHLRSDPRYVAMLKRIGLDK